MPKPGRRGKHIGWKCRSCNKFYDGKKRPNDKCCGPKCYSQWGVGSHGGYREVYSHEMIEDGYVIPGKAEV